MGFNATPQQALAMFSIVFANSENERRPQMGNWLKPHQRAPLEKARLIELEQDRRAKLVILTDAGWAWAAANLNATLPRRNWAARVLQDVLTRLGPHLDSNDAALAQFASMSSENDQIGSRTRPAKKAATRKTAGSPAAAKKTHAKRRDAKPSAAKPSAAKKAAAKKAAPKKDKTDRPVTKKRVTKKRVTKKRVTNKIEPQRSPTTKPTNSHRISSERIRIAALDLAGGQPRTRVRLRDLRVRLDDVPRAQLDRELMEMQRIGSLVLYRIDDPTDVTKDDELAALQVAGYPRHILYLES
jgi:hypothetical protein